MGSGMPARVTHEVLFAQACRRYSIGGNVRGFCERALPSLYLCLPHEHRGRLATRRKVILHEPAILLTHPLTAMLFFSPIVMARQEGHAPRDASSLRTIPAVILAVVEFKHPTDLFVRDATRNKPLFRGAALRCSGSVQQRSGREATAAAGTGTRLQGPTQPRETTFSRPRDVIKMQYRCPEYASEGRTHETSR
jgi:hypothetical protein